MVKVLWIIYFPRCDNSEQVLQNININKNTTKVAICRNLPKAIQRYSFNPIVYNKLYINAARDNKRYSISLLFPQFLSILHFLYCHASNYYCFNFEAKIHYFLANQIIFYIAMLQIIFVSLQYLLLQSLLFIIYIYIYILYIMYILYLSVIV